MVLKCLSGHGNFSGSSHLGHELDTVAAFVDYHEGSLQLLLLLIRRAVHEPFLGDDVL